MTKELSASFSPSRFYGSAKKAKLMNLEDKVLFQLNQLAPCSSPLQFHSHITGPTVVWKIFKLQKDAIDYSKCFPDVLVFSFEYQSFEYSGKRAFLVTHPLHFWQILSNRHPEECCSYEVITEGSPCKLYFDLEFDKKVNPSSVGPLMVETFIKFVCSELTAFFGVECDKRHVLWLDSTTSEKFSSHLIFNIPNVVFEDNRQIGFFVSSVCTKIEDIIVEYDLVKDVDCDYAGALQAQELSNLRVVSKDGKQVLFCDKGVYTKNRNFRLYKCTKKGKRAYLVLSDYDCFVPSQGNSSFSEKDLFLSSLITWVTVTPQTNILRFCNEIKAEVKPNLLLGSNELCSSLSFQGYQSSPYPDVDKFVEGLVKADASFPGSIRQWTYFPEKDLVVYNIAGYRFCENIGRHHKSNGIMIVADIDKEVYYQKCYDPDCRNSGYKSKESPLPEHVLPSYILNMVPETINSE